MKAIIMITVNAPEHCTEDEFLAWLKRELKQNGQLSLLNPLSKHEFDKNNCEELDITIID